MSRAYGHKFLLGLADASPGRLGIRLARACVEANLPATYVAKALEVSRMSIYSWFRGQGIREEKRESVEAFLKILQEDLDNGRLPVTSNQEGRRYIQNITGVEI